MFCRRAQRFDGQAFCCLVGKDRRTWFVVHNLRMLFIVEGFCTDMSGIVEPVRFC